jgi:MFS family permease
MPNEKLSLALIIPAVLLKSVPYGVIGAAIQIMSPARMRGQLTALYYLVISLIGMAIGPTAVAFLTERVFESLYMVGFSIAIIGAASQLLAFVFYFLALEEIWITPATKRIFRPQLSSFLGAQTRLLP